MLPNNQNQINAHNFIQGNYITNNPTININLPPIKQNALNDQNQLKINFLNYQILVLQKYDKIASYSIVPSSDTEKEPKSKYQDSSRHILRETVHMSNNQMEKPSNKKLLKTLPQKQIKIENANRVIFDKKDIYKEQVRQQKEIQRVKAQKDAAKQLNINSFNQQMSQHIKEDLNNQTNQNQKSQRIKQREVLQKLLHKNCRRQYDFESLDDKLGNEKLKSSRNLITLYFKAFQKQNSFKQPDIQNVSSNFNSSHNEGSHLQKFNQNFLFQDQINESPLNSSDHYHNQKFGQIGNEDVSQFVRESYNNDIELARESVQDHQEMLDVIQQTLALQQSKLDNLLNELVKNKQMHKDISKQLSFMEQQKSHKESILNQKEEEGKNSKNKLRDYKYNMKQHERDNKLDLQAYNNLKIKYKESQFSQSRRIREMKRMQELLILQNDQIMIKQQMIQELDIKIAASQVESVFVQKQIDKLNLQFKEKLNQIDTKQVTLDIQILTIE